MICSAMGNNCRARDRGLAVAPICTYYGFTQICHLNLQVQYYNNYLRDPKRPQMAEAPAGKPQGRRDGPHGRGPPNEQ